MTLHEEASPQNIPHLQQHEAATISFNLFPGVLSRYAFIGVFVLIGLITKNGILMVDFALQRKAEGMNSYDAIDDACLVRFGPILMTGLCAILGALPITLGYGADAASRIPLGLVVVTRAYDGLGRSAGFSLFNPANPVQNIPCGYDSLGRFTELIPSRAQLPVRRQR